MGAGRLLRVIAARRRTVEFQEERFTGADTSTYTFSGVSLGTPKPSRVIVVATGILTLGTPSSLTIGGVSATKLTSAAALNRNRPELWEAVVPSGSTADIVVGVASSKGFDCQLAVWSINGLKNTSAYDSDIGQDSATVAVPNKGVVIACARVANGSANRGPYTWSGVTEDYDRQQADYAGGSGGSLSGVSANASYTVTATPTAGLGYVSAASWS